MALKSSRLYSISLLAFAIFGCPKRQTAPRIVYVSTPPAPAEQAPAVVSAGTLVIQEPAPPQEPAESPPPVETPAPKPAPARRRVTPSEPAKEAVEQPAQQAPALEPRESVQEQAAQRNQILAMQQSIRERIARVNASRLTPLERKTLDDARTFLTQSERALRDGDLVRAMNLTRKASLLISALE